MSKEQKDSDSLHRAKLQEAYRKARETFKMLKEKARDLEQSGAEEDVSDDVKSAQVSLEILKDQMHSASSGNGALSRMYVLFNVVIQ